MVRAWRKTKEQTARRQTPDAIKGQRTISKVRPPKPPRISTHARSSASGYGLSPRAAFIRDIVGNDVADAGSRCTGMCNGVSERGGSAARSAEAASREPRAASRKPQAAERLLKLVDSAPAEHRAQHLRIADLLGWNIENIAIKHNEIG